MLNIAISTYMAYLLQSSQEPKEAGTITYPQFFR